jgi:predicted aspartyl protease
VTEAKISMQPIAYGANYTPQNIYAVGLNVELNGKKKLLEIDTGASGLLITRAGAKSAGLVPELEERAGGIGDQGPAHAYVTHVDNIKIGTMEFKNCQVNVLEQSNDLLDNVDGFIGPDVFSDYVVTLDIPMREVRLGPLPKRPDEAPAKPASLNTSNDSSAIASIAERAKDRYVAPEMKDWTPVFRSQHFLIFPTVIGKAPVKLFVMDTGASTGMITPEAAREVTRISADASTRIGGIGGDVNKVLVADFVQVTFANVSQLTQGMSAYNNSLLSDESGVEISGLIGFPTLRELIISIDYRDNLVRVVYDPRKGYHVQRPD